MITQSRHLDVEQNLSSKYRLWGLMLYLLYIYFDIHECQIYLKCKEGINPCIHQSPLKFCACFAQSQPRTNPYCTYLFKQKDSPCVCQVGKRIKYSAGKGLLLGRPTCDALLTKINSCSNKQFYGLGMQSAPDANPYIMYEHFL